METIQFVMFTALAFTLGIVLLGVVVEIFDI